MALGGSLPRFQQATDENGELHYIRLDRIESIKPDPTNAEYARIYMFSGREWRIKATPAQIYFVMSDWVTDAVAP